MDLPVFVYSLYFKTRRENLTGSCFVQTCICQGLLITEIVICIHCLIVSSPQAVRPITLSFHLSANMYVFNVKSYTESECHKQRRIFPLLQNTQREPYRLLFCPDLHLSRSIDHRDCNLHSLSHRFQSSSS